MNLPTQQAQVIEELSSVPAIKPLERRVRFYAARVFSALVGIIFALVVIEIAYRIIAARHSNPSAHDDRPKRFHLSEGLPISPWQQSFPPKSSNDFRILVLGDSFTFGPGMEPDDTFSAHLQRRLNLNKSGRAVQVINWGVPGYSTAQEVDLLYREINRVNPDLVLLQITLNDPEVQPYRVTHPWLDNHGQVALTAPIFSVWKSLRFAVSRILNSRSHREYVDYYFGLFSDPVSWDRFALSIREFKRITEQHKIKAFSVLFPLFSHPMDEQYPFTPLHMQVKNLLKDNELAVLDLSREYADIPSQRLQLIPGVDSHPNEIAHRIASDAIYRALVRRKLVPPENVATHVVNER